MVRRTVIIAACATAAIVLVARVRPVAGSGDGPTHVVAVHAGGGDVPSNLLRVYVELSAPMETGAAYRSIHLVDEAGREVQDAFLELREELWSPDQRRLTLLFDPGRVKRGIRSNVEMGPPLVAGHRYRLVIDSTWLDARNRPLARSYVAELRVAAPDRVSPDPARWSISTPRIDSRDSLRVGFDEPLDHALVMRMITVVDADGSRIAGRATSSRGDRRWTFVPAAAWPAGARLRVEPELEDLAGNNLVRPFDSDRRSGGRAAEAAVADASPRFIALTVQPSSSPAPP